MKKKFVAIMMVAAMAASMAACGSDGGSSDTQKGGSSTTTSDVANKDKPLVWFNRQPSNSSTGELDTTALNYNKDTYYVGFDANQGAELQGEMVKEYIEKNIDTIDRNGDGVIGYVLAIGDIGHNDSIARTRGVRKALGTGVDKSGEIDSAPAGTNSDGKAAEVQDGKITVNGKDYVVRELASQEMKNSAGATWDAATAGNAIGTWSSSFGESIDVVVSNNDGMGMSMFNAWSKDNKVPTFGYDANSDAVAAIAEGSIVGRNGCGKTTLLKLISGEVEMEKLDSDESAFIAKAGNPEIGYLKQIAFDDPDVTLEQEVRKCFVKMDERKAELARAAAELEHDYSDEKVARYTAMEEAFKDDGGYYYEKEYEVMIRKFGFSDDERKKPDYQKNSPNIQ